MARIADPQSADMGSNPVSITSRPGPPSEVVKEDDGGGQFYRDEEKQQSLKEYIQSKIKNKYNYDKLIFNKNIKKVKINAEKIYEKLEKIS